MRGISKERREGADKLGKTQGRADEVDVSQVWRENHAGEEQLRETEPKATQIKRPEFQDHDTFT